MSILIHIDDQSKTPLFRQIMDRIIELADSGTVKPGERLPSTRAMASALGVNRSTVYRAYQELWALGWLESRPGSYSTIRKRARGVPRPGRTARGSLRWDERITQGGRELYSAYMADEALLERAAASDVIDFIPLSPDSRLFPMDAFRKSMNDALAHEGADLLQYGGALGYGPLRESIAERMRHHGASISAEGIMITAGAQNAIDLLLKLLVGDGAAVVVEAPTYSRIIDILRLSGATIIETPMNADGMDLDVLERLLVRGAPALVYTMPNFHNPTGVTTGQRHRERLLSLCERHETPLLEDGFEEEMKYFGKVAPPIKSMDQRGVVIYIGTFSKILFPGLRVGWIAADKACIQRLAPIQRATMISGNLLDQAALHRFRGEGRCARHIRRLHRVYRKRMRTALTAMQTHLNPAWAAWNRPEGGYLIWLRLKDPRVGEDRVMDHLLARGVAALPGGSHFVGPPGVCTFASPSPIWTSRPSRRESNAWARGWRMCMRMRLAHRAIVPKFGWNFYSVEHRGVDREWGNQGARMALSKGATTRLPGF